MKFEDVKVGGILQDQYGNVYEVLEIKGEPKYIVNLKCITLVRSVKVEYQFEFKMVGQAWWVHADREELINVTNPVIRQIMNHMGVLNDECTSVTDFSVSCNGHIKHFKLATADCIAGCEVTIADMKVIPTVLDARDLTIGMTFMDGSGNYYKVIGWMQDRVHLQFVLDVKRASGKTAMILEPSFWVGLNTALGDSNITLQDFQKVTYED